MDFKHRQKTTFFIRSFLLGLLLLIGQSAVWSQEQAQQVSWEQSYSRALDLLQRFQNDSAYLIFTCLVDELREAEQLNTPFGLRVQLRQAEALEKDHQDEAAIEQLYFVVDAAKELQLADVCANAELSLARLLEKLGRPSDCQSHLAKAHFHITNHQLDSIYPRFSIRNASYHRLFGSRDSALFYAKEAIRTAPQFGLIDEKANGHMLLGLLSWNDSFTEAAKHLSTAGTYWKALGDYAGYSGIMVNLANLHMSADQPEQALVFNDSSLHASQRALASGHEDPFFIYYGYKQRSRIFRQLGQLDSAMHFMEKGYQMELDDVRKENSAQIIEIDAQYKNEQKTRQIAEQAVALEEEKRQSRRLLIAIFLALSLASIIGILYWKLRRVNRNLNSSLEHQMMLQGEIHHRVKNNLQIILSLLEMQEEEIKDETAQASLQAVANRIYSMAAVHEILYQEDDSELVNFDTYVTNLCEHINLISAGSKTATFHTAVGNHRFKLSTLMPLGIILNELLTNSLKHSKEEAPPLQVWIGLKHNNEGYCLSYQDNGPGYPSGELQAREGGLGTYLITSLSSQIEGKLETWNADGATIRLCFKEH